MTDDNKVLNAQAEIDKGLRSLLAADGLLSLGLFDELAAFLTKNGLVASFAPPAS